MDVIMPLFLALNQHAFLIDLWPDNLGASVEYMILSVQSEALAYNDLDRPLKKCIVTESLLKEVSLKLPGIRCKNGLQRSR